jgi:hypothetical protein
MNLPEGYKIEWIGSVAYLFDFSDQDRELLTIYAFNREERITALRALIAEVEAHDYGPNDPGKKK